MNRDHFIEQTVDWIERRVAPAGTTVDADTRLFESGIVDSLGILKLIAWTEKSIGRRIADREVRMDRFSSVRAIAMHFVQERDVVAERGFAAERLTTERACARCGRCALSGTAACPRKAA